MFVRPVQLFQAVGQWHVQSQEVARRNAFIASAELAEKRRERDEVEQFLAARVLTRSESTPVSGPGSTDVERERGRVI